MILPGFREFTQRIARLSRKEERSIESFSLTNGEGRRGLSFPGVPFVAAVDSCRLRSRNPSLTPFNRRTRLTGACGSPLPRRSTVVIDSFFFVLSPSPPPLFVRHDEHSGRGGSSRRMPRHFLRKHLRSSLTCALHRPLNWLNGSLHDHR